jgi:hypothetical protein
MRKYQAETLRDALVLVNRNTPESVTEGLAAILLLCIQEVNISYLGIMLKVTDASEDM